MTGAGQLQNIDSRLMLTLEVVKNKQNMKYINTFVNIVEFTVSDHPKCRGCSRVIILRNLINLRYAGNVVLAGGGRLREVASHREVRR